MPSPTAGRCDACGHDARDRDLIGVPIGPMSNIVLVACGSCRAAYARTGRLPHGLAHCSPVETDQDVTDDLFDRGYVDGMGHWPLSDAAEAPGGGD